MKQLVVATGTYGPNREEYSVWRAPELPPSGPPQYYASVGLQTFPVAPHPLPRDWNAFNASTASWAAITNPDTGELGARIDPKARFEHQSIAGPGAQIDADTDTRYSFIGTKVRMQTGSQAYSSVVGAGTWACRKAQVIESHTEGLLELPEDCRVEQSTVHGPLFPREREVLRTERVVLTRNIGPGVRVKIKASHGPNPPATPPPAPAPSRSFDLSGAIEGGLNRVTHALRRLVHRDRR